MRRVLSACGVAASCAALLLALGAGVARADAIIEVNTTSDVGSDTCLPSSGTCSLRQALELTEVGLIGGDVDIWVKASGTIDIASRGPLVVDPAPEVETLEIRGPGAEQLSIDGGQSSEIFDVVKGSNTISGLTLKHGASSGAGGGAIHQSGGSLSVVGVQLEENAALGGLPGGAIFQQGGDLTVRESGFSENRAEKSPTHSGDGGAIFAGSAAGELDVEDCEFFANEADDNGGAIYVAAGNARVRGGEFTGNGAGVDGGAILTESPGSLTTGQGVTFLENKAMRGGGLMVRAGAGEVLVAESWFSGNEASGQGGGMYAAAATTVERSTFSGNTSPSNTEHSGGGIATAEVPLTLDESTLTGNVGGAVDLGGEQVTIRGSTIVGNTDPHNIGAGVAGEATVTSSILYGNEGTEGEGNCEGTMLSGGDNIVGTPGEFCGWETAPGDVFGVDPLLGPLADNGGPTPTIAPISRLSPAINHGSEPGPTDQRGLARPVPAGAANTDVGAVEVQAPALQEAPTISPDSRLVTGEELPCLAGSWDEDTVEDASRSYEWLLDGQAVATGPAYTLRESDVGKPLACRETVDDGATTASAESEQVELEPGVALLLPTEVGFGSRNVAAGPSAPRTLTLSNKGGTALAVGSAEIGGADASQFKLAGGCEGTVLPPGGECEYEVSFEPTAAGAKAATLTVETNGGDRTVELTGTGTVPVTEITPTAHDFGERPVGSGPGAATSFAVKNTGDGPLTIGQVALEDDEGGDFELAAGGDGCSGATLPAGEECDVEVAFAPQAPGPRSATLTVPGDAPTATAQLTGTGTAPGFEATPPALAFGAWDVGAGPGEPLTVSVSNDGDAAMALGTVATDGSEMTVVAASDTCSQQRLEPGNTCSVAVAFDPTTVGPVAETLEFPGAPPGSAVGLTGIGVVSDLAALPTSVDFGDVDLGKSVPTTVTVTNQGLAPVTAGNADLSGSPLFIVLDDGCAGQALAPSASCDLTVAFTASQTGPQTATLTVAPEGDGAPAQVTLAATGLGPTPIDPLPVPLEPPPIPGPSCRVPKLLGRSLDAARKTLRNHNCRLGAVAGRKQKGARFVRQHPRQGRTLPANAPVSVKVRG